jgi:FAD/FMN-containing dehydrogenase
MNFDIQSSVVQQFNVGFSHMRWPNLSYYIGSRYLRRFDNGLGEEGSNAFVFAATYVLDPRYTIVFSQQFDFDYGENVRSDITLIRRYHRIYWGITFSADESLDSHAIVFSLWPEGVPGLGIGPRRYMELGPSVGAGY